MNYFKRLETILIAIVILVLGVAYGLMSDKKYPTPAEVQVGSQAAQQGQQQATQMPADPDAHTRYAGVEGKTAMELLKSFHTVETQDFGDLGEFVESIDGMKPDSRHYWAFYLNGEQSQVGASAYVTKPTDIIEWVLEEIK